ncbi:unnamed protein product [Pleuronectes platessa]|uniref:Uncharacterized protein n=1 Tax=Pleuronectes platessa TaxID=8262 RepID=A0A9N7VYT8_PLEPL|nr:unnamed protein product [Pleuronectes platessa]
MLSFRVQLLANECGVKGGRAGGHPGARGQSGPCGPRGDPAPCALGLAARYIKTGASAISVGGDSITERVVTTVGTCESWRAGGVEGRRGGGDGEVFHLTGALQR